MGGVWKSKHGGSGGSRTLRYANNFNKLHTGWQRSGKKRLNDEGPFLREERNLIDAIAERIAKFIEREWAEDEKRKHRNRDESR